MSLNLNSTYRREEALEEGALIDVSDVAKSRGIPWPVAMSVYLWNDIHFRWKDNRLGWVLSHLSTLFSKDYWERDEHGHRIYRTYEGPETPPFLMRIVVENEGKSDVTVTLLHYSEQFDRRRRPDRASSFYIM